MCSSSFSTIYYKFSTILKSHSISTKEKRKLLWKHREARKLRDHSPSVCPCVHCPRATGQCNVSYLFLCYFSVPLLITLCSLRFVALHATLGTKIWFNFRNLGLFWKEIIVREQVGMKVVNRWCKPPSGSLGGRLEWGLVETCHFYLSRLSVDFSVF
jgi:hypothetical protein